MEESKRKKNYNPADYAELERQAKEMDRKKLESFYVEKKDKAYMPVILGLLLTIRAIVGVFTIFILSLTFASDGIINKLEDTKDILVEDICPVMEDYQFTILEESKFFGFEEVTIDCQE